MYQAAWKIGSDFLRSDSDVYHIKKISFIGYAGFGFTGKILLVCFPAFLRPAFGCPRVARPAFGSRQKSRKKQLKNTQKTSKTEHKNVGLYAQKTAHSAY
jgi:hypothetical protein